MNIQIHFPEKRIKNGKIYELRLAVEMVETKRMIVIYTERWEFTSGIRDLSDRKSAERYLDECNWDSGNVSIMEMIGKELNDMKHPASFVSSQISEEEVLDELFLNIILGNDKLRVIYITEEVNRVVDDYQKNLIWIEGTAYPKFIPQSSILVDLCQLQIVDARHCYYVSVTDMDEGSVIMINRNTKAIVSDNYFAYEAFVKKTESIAKDKDCLYIGMDLENIV